MTGTAGWNPDPRRPDHDKPGKPASLEMPEPHQLSGCWMKAGHGKTGTGVYGPRLTFRMWRVGIPNGGSAEGRAWSGQGTMIHELFKPFGGVELEQVSCTVMRVTSCEGASEMLSAGSGTVAISSARSRQWTRSVASTRSLIRHRQVQRSPHAVGARVVFSARSFTCSTRAASRKISTVTAPCQSVTS